MLKVSEMVVRSALFRTESRGAHYRLDFPEENNDQWLQNIEVSQKDGSLSLKSVLPALSPITLETA
jgi:succinate dehydrogenase/fumarate reductase flavoprotein subunit